MVFLAVQGCFFSRTVLYAHLSCSAKVEAFQTFFSAKLTFWNEEKGKGGALPGRKRRVFLSLYGLEP